MPVLLCPLEHALPNHNSGQLWVLLLFGLGERTVVQELCPELVRVHRECPSEVCQPAVFKLWMVFCSLRRQTTPSLPFQPNILEVKPEDLERS